MKYSYIAVITPNEDSSKFFVRFPDLPGCVTSGKNIGDALNMAADAAAVWLVSAEDLGDPAIPATPQCDIFHDQKDLLFPVHVDTSEYRTSLRARRQKVK